MILLNPFVVVHPTHILVHPRVHRAHRLKSSALEVLLQANSVVTLLVNSRGDVPCMLCSPRQETLR